ncbi:YhcH/YjgK/YiaL family protein [Sedimentibacter sp.]|uniref:YhcH/YjgK/YiaL family protein n=1 Tax=Sedimentibacter sp. TaxID=1960295 RepID=UPI00289B8481|nr:YhcH/YjgK/YiaL family protein [Sedimentibacter sp.]
MIYGNLKNLGESNAYQEVVYRVLKYLKNKDFNNMEPGKYEIEGNDIYFSVTDTKTDTIENKKAESHAKYIDIQLSPNGGELMGFATDEGGNEIIENKLKEKDVLKYSAVDNEKFVKMNPNDFFVFYPWDIHRPGCTDAEPCDIRKVIVKIKMELI